MDDAGSIHHLHPRSKGRRSLPAKAASSIIDWLAESSELGAGKEVPSSPERSTRRRDVSRHPLSYNQLQLQRCAEGHDWSTVQVEQEQGSWKGLDRDLQPPFASRFSTVDDPPAAAVAKAAS